MVRKVVQIDSSLASKIGYSRAVRVANQAYVSGTTAFGDGGVTGKGDAGIQARVCIEKIGQALVECGLRLEDVVRTRVTLARIEDWEAVAAAHLEFFGEIRPVSAFYAGVQFLHPDILVEIEADAISE